MVTQGEQWMRSMYERYQQGYGMCLTFSLPGLYAKVFGSGGGRTFIYDALQLSFVKCKNAQILEGSVKLEIKQHAMFTTPKSR